MIAIQNVKKRVSALRESTSTKVNAGGILSNLEKNYNFDSVKTLTEHFQSLDSDPIYAFDKVLDLFEMVCIQDPNTVHVVQLSSMIQENVMPKIRNAKQMQNSIIRKHGSIKRKIIGKVNATISKAKTAVGMQATTNNSSSNPDSKEKSAFLNNKKEEEKRINQMHECFDKFESQASLLESCDKVWLTHATVSKRFNLKKIYSECGDTEECVNELCMLLDTFDVPFRAKFNICLENVQYEFAKHNSKVSRSDLAKMITEYFLVAGSVCDQYQIIEDTSSQMVKSKLTTYASRLKRNKNTQVAAIGGKLEKFLIECSYDAMELFDTGRNVIVSIIELLSTASFIAVVGVGIIALLISVVLGILIMLTASTLIEMIGKPAYEKFKKTVAGSKGAKKRELMRLQKKAEEGIGYTTKTKEMELREAFIIEEFMSNKYDMDHVLDINKFYNKSDITEAKSLLNDKSYKIIKNIGIEETVLGTANKMSSGMLKNTTKAKEYIIKLKNTPIKTPDAIKSCIKQVYTDSADNIIDETPNIFKILFSVIVITGALSINIGLGIIVAMTHYFIGMNCKRKEVAKYLKKYKSEKSRAERRLNTIKDQSTKERCVKYIDTLDKQIARLEEYQDNLYTDKENDDRKYGSDSDFDISKELGECVVDIVNLEALCEERLKFDPEKVIDYIRDSKLDKSIIKSLVEASINYDLIDRKLLEEAIDDRIFDSKRDFGNWEAARAAKDILTESFRHKPINNIYLEVSVCRAIDNYFNAISLEESAQVINEMDVVNSVKMLIDTAKRKATNVSDSEKIASRTLDQSLENLRASMTNALKQENKEAVIRGSILPPMSRIIKLALASGIAWVVSPAIAIIGLVGVFVMSKGIRAKERQIVLDEIDTELQITERYIDQAKEKNDMKALRQCLTIQKKLMRQRDRLKFKMRVDYDEKTPDSYDKDRD